LLVWLVGLLVIWSVSLFVRRSFRQSVVWKRNEKGVKFLFPCYRF